MVGCQEIVVKLVLPVPVSKVEDSSQPESKYLPVTFFKRRPVGTEFISTFPSS